MPNNNQPPETEPSNYPNMALPDPYCYHIGSANARKLEKENLEWIVGEIVGRLRMGLILAKPDDLSEAVARAENVIRFALTEMLDTGYVLGSAWSTNDGALCKTSHE